MPRPALWTAIADTLRDEITSRQRAPGDKLPTEAALAQRFGVNRHTVRRALKTLACEDLVISRRGAGVFVATTMTLYPVGRRTRFAQNVLASGRSPERKMLLLETAKAKPEEATALGIEPGAAVHVYEGLSMVDDAPIALFRSVFPAERLPKLGDHLRQTSSITSALKSEGIDDYTRASTQVTALRATAPQAQHLMIKPSDPILQSVSVNIDLIGCPVEYGCAWFAGDRVTLTLSPED